MALDAPPGRLAAAGREGRAPAVPRLLPPAQLRQRDRADPRLLLSGVAGDLDANDTSNIGFAGVWTYSGGWYFRTKGSYEGAKVKATTLCVPSIANRTGEIRWSSGQAAKVLAPVTANRRCGLMSVWNNGGDKWQAAGDSVQVWNDGTNWYIGGTGNALGDGSCVDVSPGTGIGVWT
jgi:hypothetical protein